MSPEVEKLYNLIHVNPGIQNTQKARKEEKTNIGKFSVKMSPLELLKSIGDMFMHNSKILRESWE